MENLYTFSKSAWHVKLFIWMWGINPVDKYKTMCPYFWTFFGSIIIFPLIILYKIIRDNIVFPLRDYLDNIAEKSAEKATAKLLKEWYAAKTPKEKYNLYKSSCFSKYLQGLINMGEISSDEELEFFKITLNYEKSLRNKNEFKKAKLMTKIDVIKYGIIGKIILYIISALILYIVYIFLNWLFHLFTIEEFLYFLLGIVTIVIIFGVVILLIWGVGKINSSCNNFISRYNPFNFIKRIFIGILKLFIIIFQMFKNLYKQSCPIITWKD